MQAGIDVLRFPGTKTAQHEDELVLEEFSVESAWGATVEPVDRQERFRKGGPLSGIIDASGEWWCVATATDGRKLVLADRFGIQPLAYIEAHTLDGTGLFVGRSAALVAAAVRAAGGELQTDWAHVLETISAQHDFLDCLFDESTPTQGVRWIPADSVLEVSASGYRIVPRPHKATSGSYEQMLERGIELAVADVQHLVDTHERIAINLSGGKDSRVVLALAMASGRMDRVHVSATDPTPPGGSTAHAPTVQQDLEISSRLVEGLNLRWVDWRSPRDMWPTTLEGELARFQDLRHGLSNQFAPLGLAYRLTEGEARLTGAGGEIYRDYWAGVLSKHPVWKKLGHTPTSVADDAKALLRALRSQISFPSELADRGEEAFANALLRLPGSTIGEKLDRHYEGYRMRGHAGGRLWGRSYGNTNVALLQQSSLKVAAEQLDSEERYSGKILFDIIEKAAPELNDLEYQSGPWPWKADRPQIRDWSGVRSDEAAYRAAQERSRKSTVPQKYRGRPRPDMSTGISQGLDALGRQMHEDGLDPSILDPITRNPPTGLRLEGRMLARLFNWASSFGDERMLPRAISQGPPSVRTYIVANAG